MKTTIENCPFCSPTIERLSWLETEKVRVVYNTAPLLPGHSLVLPKRHVSSLLELSDSEINELFQVARKAALILLRVFQGDGFDISLQDGEAAGQTVAHLHIHVLPRKFGDPLSNQDWHNQLLDSQSRPRLSDEDLLPIVQKLREEVICDDDSKLTSTPSQLTLLASR